MQCKDQGLVGGAYPISWHYVNSSYCAVYNLTERRFVAPFENLTLLGLMMGRRGRERNGGIGYGATIQAGIICDRFTSATARRDVKRRARCWKNSLGSAAITA